MNACKSKASRSPVNNLHTTVNDFLSTSLFGQSHDSINYKSKISNGSLKKALETFPL